MVKTISFAFSFYPGLIRCLIYSVLEAEHKSTKNGIAMGVTIGSDAAKSGKITNLLVVMCVRLLQKIGLLDLTNRNKLNKRKRLVHDYWGIDFMLHTRSIY